MYYTPLSAGTYNEENMGLGQNMLYKNTVTTPLQQNTILDDMYTYSSSGT